MASAFQSSTRDLIKKVEQRLFQSDGRRRYTQDTPILPDVWEYFLSKKKKELRDGKPVIDVLITPFQNKYDSVSPAKVAMELAKKLGLVETEIEDEAGHCLSYNQTHVAVKLTFEELVSLILPLSNWWKKTINGFWDAQTAADKKKSRTKKTDGPALNPALAIKSPAGRRAFAQKLAADGEEKFGFSRDFLWIIHLIYLMSLELDPQSKNFEENSVEYYSAALEYVEKHLKFDRVDADPLIFAVTSNRPAEMCLSNSVLTIKADAVKCLFEIDCSAVTWAIVDSGIDARHLAFRKTVDGKLMRLPKKGDWTNRTRITRTYDFTVIRDIINGNNKGKRISIGDRQALKKRLINGRSIDWEMLTTHIEVKHDESYDVLPDDNHHGTHVAGIIGGEYQACWKFEPFKERDHRDNLENLQEDIVGVCPNINLIDLRIFKDGHSAEEFNIIAAMQFLRYLNSHSDFQVVHGVNLSLSLRHDVRNYACGRTPICEECRRAVGSGLVVVVAAGNQGFDEKLSDGYATGREYRDISLTDPGNTEDVITVGSTHARDPHAYGVSYFSSRGPTGDGRMKPDLVAPGEKIRSACPNNGVIAKDGTSMAAPHVSGAAALIMARNYEFVGQPRRIKELLCKSATDLGRLKEYQGHGLVDVLRALQSV